VFIKFNESPQQNFESEFRKIIPFHCYLVYVLVLNYMEEFIKNKQNVSAA